MTSGTGGSDAYSEVADAQLDALEMADDADLYNAVLDSCELIFASPGEAQALSSAIQTDQGIRFRLPVQGHYPYKVFWPNEPSGVRVEAVFAHP